jgi:hypothetical protein
MAERKKMPHGRPLVWARISPDVPTPRRALSRQGRVVERWQHHAGPVLERVEWFTPALVTLDGRRLLRRGAWHLYWTGDAPAPIATSYTTGHGRRLIGSPPSNTLWRSVKRWADVQLRAHAESVGEKIPAPAEFSIFAQAPLLLQSVRVRHSEHAPAVAAETLQPERGPHTQGALPL